MPHQSGFTLLSGLLFATAIFASIVLAVLGSGTNVIARLDQNKLAQLIAQSQLIATRISKCALDYPAGNNGTGNHVTYPGGLDVKVKALICPGSNLNLWSGVDGVYLPPPPDAFGAWTYTNATPLTIQISSTQPGKQAAVISAAAAKIGPAASATADTLTVKIIE